MAEGVAELQGPLAGRRRSGQILSVGEDQGEPVVGVGAVGLEGDGLAQFPLGLLELAQAPPGEREVDARPRVGGSASRAREKSLRPAVAVESSWAMPRWLSTTERATLCSR